MKNFKKSLATGAAIAMGTCSFAQSVSYSYLNYLQAVAASENGKYFCTQVANSQSYIGTKTSDPGTNHNLGSLGQSATLDAIDGSGNLYGIDPSLASPNSWTIIPADYGTETLIGSGSTTGYVSSITSANDTGELTGNLAVNSSIYAGVYGLGGWSIIGPAGSLASYVNDAGFAVGEVSQNYIATASLFYLGGSLTLNYPASNLGTYAHSISQNGTYIAGSYTNSSSLSMPIVWTYNQSIQSYFTIPLLAGTTSGHALFANDFGTVYGTDSSASGTVTPWIYSKGHVYDVNSILQQLYLSATFNNALSLNDSNQLIGNYTSQGQLNSGLFTFDAQAAPEPAAALPILAGICGFVAFTRRKR